MPLMFQKIVSGKRRRLDDGIVNLDLSYITDRVIGMSFPASKFKEQLYRNNIENVANFFDDRHNESYMIYNMSNRNIEVQYFHHNVVSYPWEDHHSPTLPILFQVCEHMFTYLLDNSNNVVCVNCNAGKGRTGTAISCFQIYSHLTDNFIDAITYYGWKRFTTGRGVSQPSQQRYVQYFEMALKKQIQSPIRKKLNKIMIKTLPESTGQIIIPTIEILEATDFSLIWTNNPNYKYKNGQKKSPQSIMQQYKVGKDNLMIIYILDENTGEGVELCGDVQFKLVNAKSNKMICRFAMNTSFINTVTNKYKFSKKSVEPDSILKNKKFDNDFQIELNFQDSCHKCQPTMPLERLCNNCSESMKDEIKGWMYIRDTIKKHEDRLIKVQNDIFQQTLMRNPTTPKKATSVRMAKDKSFKDVGIFVNYWRKENHKEFKTIIQNKYTHISCEVLSEANQMIYQQHLNKNQQQILTRAPESSIQNQDMYNMDISNLAKTSVLIKDPNYMQQMLSQDRADAQFNTSRRNMVSQNLQMEGRNTLEEFNMLFQMGEQDDPRTKSSQQPHDIVDFEINNNYIGKGGVINASHMKSVQELLKQESLEEEKKREDEDQDMFLKNMVNNQKRDIENNDVQDNILLRRVTMILKKNKETQPITVNYVENDALSQKSQHSDVNDETGKFNSRIYMDTSEYPQNNKSLASRQFDQLNDVDNTQKQNSNPGPINQSEGTFEIKSEQQNLLRPNFDRSDMSSQFANISMLQDELADGGYRQRNTQVIRGGRINNAQGAQEDSKRAQNNKMEGDPQSKNSKNGDKSENDYLLTGHGKITFNLQQQKIIGKRKNSADRAKDILEKQQKKIEKLLKQQMEMYDDFFPHQEAYDDVAQAVDSSMLAYCMLNNRESQNKAVSQYLKGQGQIAKPGD